jgi:diaminohydroxyphosphoribosylaminopyrimidine deaminase / 5-amino-6-(5-phosphoribosylamino)uracil reductase
VMLEAGSRLNSAAFASHLVDKLCLFYAPVFLGSTGVPLFADARRIDSAGQRITWKTIGSDVCFESYIHDPWK